MNAYYAIKVYDRSKSRDRVISRRVLRTAASRIVSQLNRESMERHGQKGPLYYLERVQYESGRLKA